ncbi:hypothetical protein Tco_0724830 [Tanacetum coccineum]|uniref:Uncharacterized protein n=1 Tax=Tanacetum coccineum TaxID=301880 RepID=A0ABQ4YB75_9ASTR
METKDTLSSCTDSEEMEMQRLQKKASIMKGSFLNGLSALKSHLTLLSKKDVPDINASECELAFSHIFGEDVHTFTRMFSQNMATLETQLTNETLHESNCKTAFGVLKTPFDKNYTLVLIRSSNSDGTYSRKDFKAYTRMEPQVFKEIILANFDFIQKYMIESKLHNKEIKQWMNAKKLQIQENKVQEVKASDASSGDKDNSGIVSNKGNDQSLKNQSNTLGDESSRSRNECNDKSTSGDDTDIRPSYDTEPMLSNVIPDSPDMCDNEIQTDHNTVECDDERVALANLFSNIKLDVDENKKIQKQLKKANASLTQELKECKSTLTETSRTLGESNSIRDSCLIALQNNTTELEKYLSFNDRTIDYDKLERKLNETLGLLAQKDIDIKEGLKLKAYEILVVKEKHDDLVKLSLLTKLHYEGLVKEKIKVITD